MARPPLPFTKANSQLDTLDPDALPPVKYQVLSCQGQDILVGRMKIPTPTGSGHAFILRRYDTGAISATTMFRAAFPEATEQEEKKEAAWIKETFDVTKNNGSSKDHTIVRLAGIWVTPDDALTLAGVYGLSVIIKAMAMAQPDPNANYRRSGKGDKGSPSSPPDSQVQSSPAPPVTPTPSKRRKESAAQPAKAQPASLAPPRRSARTKSNSPAPPATPPRKTTRTAKSTKTSRSMGLQDSDETAVDEDAEAAARMGYDMLKEDVAEQHALIANLKAQKDGEMDDNSGKQSKRGRDIAEQDYPSKLNIHEPEKGERAIASNPKVRRFQMAPQPKSFAWGVAALAVGFGAVTMWPNLANLPSLSNLSNLM